MFNKTYWGKVIVVVLISSLLNTWIFTFFTPMNTMSFVIFYMVFYFVILGLTLFLCAPLMILTDLIGREWGYAVTWILKIANYHLPVFITRLVIVAQEGWDLTILSEIAVFVLFFTEIIIKRISKIKISLFVTLGMYTAHVLLFLIGLVLFSNPQIL